MWKTPVVVSLLLANTLFADEVVSVGDTFGLLAPHPPYDPAQGLTVEVTLGYGDPGNTIGDGIWFSAPGVFGVSNDPDIEGFFTYATNGLDDTMTMEITDGDGFQHVLLFSAGWEGAILGNAPDLSPLEVTGGQLRVFDAYIDDSDDDNLGLVVARWEFLAVPEPTTIGLMALGGIVLCWRRWRSTPMRRQRFP
jgi:hypothetical protein